VVASFPAVWLTVETAMEGATAPTEQLTVETTMAGATAPQWLTMEAVMERVATRLT
jgi:hypothetical protein